MAIGSADLVSAFRLAAGDIETVDAFKYLGSFASSAIMQRKIAQRLSNAGHAYDRLQKLRKDAHLAISVKLTVYKTDVLSSLLYGGETWAWTQGTVQPFSIVSHEMSDTTLGGVVAAESPKLLHRNFGKVPHGLY